MDDNEVKIDTITVSRYLRFTIKEQGAASMSQNVR